MADKITPLTENLQSYAKFPHSLGDCFRNSRKQERVYQIAALLGLLPIIRATTSQPLEAWSWKMESGPNSEQLEEKGQRTRRGLNGLGTGSHLSG